jgi:hypothetical protein
MGKGWAPLRWLLQPFTTGMAAPAAGVPTSSRRLDRATRILGDQPAAPGIDPAAQARIDAFVAHLVADYEPAAFVIESAVEPVAGTTDHQQVVLLYPKGRRHDGAGRRCEELTVAVLPNGANELQHQQAAALAHLMRKQIDQRLRDDAGWLDAELEAGLILGFPADWRDYRFVG